MPDNNTNIILFPEYEELKDAVTKLQSQLSEKLLQKDDLVYVICKNIEMQYMLELGALEYKVYEAQCLMLRLKRKMELIQIKRNRQEEICLLDVEKILDEEFEKYQEKLNEQIEKMNRAIDYSKGEVLTEEENLRFKKIYRTIVKELHPDLNKDLTPAQVNLFQNAVEAYKNGDLKTLEIINVIVESKAEHKEENSTIKNLIIEKERLENLIKSIDESIEEIKNRFPYNVKDIIEDENKKREYEEHLQSLLAQYTEMSEIYEDRINKMVI